MIWVIARGANRIKKAGAAALRPNTDLDSLPTFSHGLIRERGVQPSRYCGHTDHNAAVAGAGCYAAFLTVLAALELDPARPIPREPRWTSTVWVHSGSARPEWAESSALCSAKAFRHGRGRQHDRATCAHCQADSGSHSMFCRNHAGQHNVDKLGIKGLSSTVENLTKRANQKGCPCWSQMLRDGNGAAKE